MVSKFVGTFRELIEDPSVSFFIFRASVPIGTQNVKLPETQSLS